MLLAYLVDGRGVDQRHLADVVGAVVAGPLVVAVADQPALTGLDGLVALHRRAPLGCGEDGFDGPGHDRQLGGRAVSRCARRRGEALRLGRQWPSMLPPLLRRCPNCGYLGLALRFDAVEGEDPALVECPVCDHRFETLDRPWLA